VPGPDGPGLDLPPQLAAAYQSGDAEARAAPA
jgi:hypothetical protein